MRSGDMSPSTVAYLGHLDYVCNHMTTFIIVLLRSFMLLMLTHIRSKYMIEIQSCSLHASLQLFMYMK